MAKNYCLYHAKCPDGIWSAWVVYTVLGDNCEYIPVNYQELPPAMEAGSTVYIVDFSYPMVFLNGLVDDKQIIVLDHHKTAMEQLLSPQLDSRINCEFALDESGATLTWKYFKKTPTPKILEYVKDRDLWQHKLPFTHQIYSALRNYLNFENPDFKAMSNLAEHFEKDFQKYVNEGQAEFEERQAEVRTKALSHGWAIVGGYKVPIVYAARFYSDIANLLCHMYLECPFAACYRTDGDKIKYDLRSLGEFDVSTIAKEYGGGGHKNASGFSLEAKEALEIKYLR